MDGQIKEVVYKGQHNHPKPLPNRRLGLGGAVLPNTGDDKYDGFVDGIFSLRSPLLSPPLHSLSKI